MIVSFLIGLLMGILYFGGLYFSTQKFNSAKSPALFMILSFVLRMGILIVGFYYLSKSGYKNILIGLLGVMLVRFIMVFNIKNRPSKSIKERKWFYEYWSKWNSIFSMGVY